MDPNVLTRVPGVTLRDASGTTVPVSVEGAVGPVATAAAALDLVDVVATPADLDELFRTFYARPRAARWRVSVPGDITRPDQRQRRRSMLAYF